MRILGKHNVLFYKAKSLNAELESARELFESFNGEFLKEVSEHRGGEKSPLCVNPDFMRESIERLFEDDIDIKLFKPLYRRIMILAHPDKLASISDENIVSHYSEICVKAVSAMESGSWYMLYDAALDIGIKNVSVKNEHINLIKDDYEKIEEEINRIKNSVAWVWFHSENEQKDKYIKYYVKKSAGR